MFKKYKLMFFYMKTIKKYLPEIEKKIISKNNNRAYTISSIKIDNIYRLYTVLNLKKENTKNLELYGYPYLDNEIKKFVKEINNELREIGLTELIGLSRIDKIGENNVLIVIEYKLFDIGKFFKKLIYLGISIISIIIFLLFFYL